MQRRGSLAIGFLVHPRLSSPIHFRATIATALTPHNDRAGFNDRIIYLPLLAPSSRIGRECLTLKAARSDYVLGSPADGRGRKAQFKSIVLFRFVKYIPIRI